MVWESCNDLDSPDLSSKRTQHKLLIRCSRLFWVREISPAQTLAANWSSNSCVPPRVAKSVPAKKSWIRRTRTHIHLVFSRFTYTKQVTKPHPLVVILEGGKPTPHYNTLRVHSFSIYCLKSNFEPDVAVFPIKQARQYSTGLYLTGLYSNPQHCAAAPGILKVETRKRLIVLDPHGRRPLLDTMNRTE